MLRWTGARTVSAGRVGALAGLVEGWGFLIVLDGSLGSGRRRTLGRAPQLQVAQILSMTLQSSIRLTSFKGRPQREQSKELASWTFLIIPKILDGTSAFSRRDDAVTLSMSGIDFKLECRFPLGPMVVDGELDR